MGHVSHWDEVEPTTVEEPAHLRATWRDLGRAAGAVGASVQLVDIAPGCRNSPVHQHFHEEEFVFVLAGSGWSWQDGAG